MLYLFCNSYSAFYSLNYHNKWFIAAPSARDVDSSRLSLENIDHASYSADLHILIRDNLFKHWSSLFTSDRCSVG